MRPVVLGCWFALAAASAGCRVCLGACEKAHGRVVTGIVPRADGTMAVTTCDLVTKGNGSTVSRCRDVEIGAPTGAPAASDAPTTGVAP